LASALATAAVMAVFALIMVQILGQINTAIRTRSVEFNEQSEIESFLFKLQKIAGNGVNLQGTTASLNATNLTWTTPGQVITNFNSTSLASDGSVNTLALFYREAARIGSTGSRISRIQPTGIYFMQPNAAKRAPGFLLVDPGDGATLTAKGEDFYFSSIVALQTLGSQILPTPNGVVLLRSVLLQITFRKFLSGTPDTWVYCPGAQMGTGICITTATYIDTVKTFRINFRNNYDPNAPGFSMFGRVYFFN
jgi:hypothetical protein